LRAAVAVALGLALGGAAAGQPPAGGDKYAIDPDRFIFARVEDDAPVRSEAENREEYDAYNEVLLHARRFPPAELEAHATRDVTLRDLVQPVRQDFRFKLVYFEGRLKRVRRLEPTAPLRAAGVTDLYEGWVFPGTGRDPLCVLTTALPPGLAPALEYTPTRPVAVAGYSFKRIRYESAEDDPKEPGQKVVRRVPLLLAHSLTLRPEPDADGGRPWRTGFLPGMLAIMGAIAAVTLGLTWWYRRGDRAARRALAARRTANPFDGPDRQDQ
jgi:hypothetical protein